MNKSEFIKAVAAQTGVKDSEASKIWSAGEKVIIDALKGGDKVVLGIGAFEAKKSEARTGINPKTKEKITIAASTKPNFKAGKAFKDALN